ncbi:putative mitochondrial protein [Vitis vinifera]|uniref:Putative mitochondrial protein n=1 Tax=Vitis vinifera TaxID=29760 RepID=A0A438FFB7_VITVI|nr:putative mitochondrial protein [Vitis vinifera]
MKVLQSRFCWPSLFKDAHIMCRSCDRCQRLEKLTRRNQMPMNPILIVDLFDVWGIDFMRPFPMSFGNFYILVGVDYVSKWVEASPVNTMITGCQVWSEHKVATPYHPQTSGQVELANREIKEHIDEGLVGNQKVNHGLDQSRAKRCLDLNEMEELRNDAYINSKVAKQRMKRWHDQLISNKEFQKGQRVLLYDSRLHIFPGKLKSRWIGPFIIHQVHLNGVVKLLNSNSTSTFKVYGHSSQAIH